MGRGRRDSVMVGLYCVRRSITLWIVKRSFAWNSGIIIARNLHSEGLAAGGGLLHAGRLHRVSSHHPASTESDGGGGRGAHTSGAGGDACAAESNGRLRHNRGGDGDSGHLCYGGMRNQKWSIAGNEAAFRDRVLDEFSRSVGFTFERENDGPARSITRQKLDQKRFSDRRLTLAFLGREKGSQIREVCFPGPLNFVVFSASASELLFSQRSAQLFADEWLVEIVPYVASTTHQQWLHINRNSSLLHLPRLPQYHFLLKW